jgi:hypothetical protein
MERRAAGLMKVEKIDGFDRRLEGVVHDDR